MKRVRTLVLAALFAAVAPLAFAEDIEAAPTPDPNRPAIGVWVGSVSWNEPIVRYVWFIEPDSTFSSGRLGRGANGGGAWSGNGDHVTLKYDDGFRYEGALRGNVYSGQAYTADDRAYGSFWMHRDMKDARPEESE